MSGISFRLHSFVGLAVLLILLAPVWVAAQEGRGVDEVSLAGVSLVSPLDLDVVSGRVVFLFSVDSSSRITEIGVRLSRGDERDSLFTVSSSSSWSGEWDSASVPNGEYLLSFDACVESRCAENLHSIRVIVDNLPTPSPSEAPSDSRPRDNPSSRDRTPDVEERPSAEENVPPAPTFVLFPPSEFSLVKIHSSSQDTVLARSSGDPLTLEEGVYDASIQFPSHVISSVFLDDFDFSHDGQLVALSSLPLVERLVYREKSYPVLSGFIITTGFSAKEISVRVLKSPEQSLFYCTRFDVVSNQCTVTWSPSPISGDSFAFSFTSSSVAVAFVPSIRDEPPVLALHDITFSSIPGVAYYVSSPGQTSEGFSSTQSVSLPEGTYGVRLSFDDFPFSGARFSDAVLDHDGTFFSARPLPSDVHPGSSAVWLVHVGFSFSRSALRLASGVDSNIFSCGLVDVNSFSCSSWVPFSLNSLVPGTTMLAFFPREGEEIVPPAALDEELASLIFDLQRLHSNKRFFTADEALDRFPVLNTLFSEIEVDLECAPPASVVRGEVDSSPSSIQDIAPAEGIIPAAGPGLNDIPLSDSPVSVVPPSVLPPEFTDVSSPSFYTNAWEEVLGVHPEWRQRENILSCDGVSLAHSFVSTGFPPDTESTIFLGAPRDSVKQLLTVSNETTEWQRRLVNIRLVSPHSELSSDSSSYVPSSSYVRVPSSIIFPDENNPFSSPSISDAVVRFSSRGGELGYYSVEDFLLNHHAPRSVVHRVDGETIVETLLEVSIPPSSSVVLDPIYSLSTVTNYSTRWNGGASGDQAGRLYNNTASDSNQLDGPGIELVNVDNGAYANDLIIMSPRADVNGKTDAGALYLIRNVDSKFGNSDLLLDSNFTSRWSGSMDSQQIGYVGEPGRGYHLGDFDGNGYSNDIIIVAPTSDFPFQNSGSIYFIKNIDTKPGAFDLNHHLNYDARLDGAPAEFMGRSLDADSAILLADTDNNGYANDLILTVPTSDAIGTDVGGVAIFRDIGRFVGTAPALLAYNLVYLGEAADDTLGGSGGGGALTLVVDSDGNGYANDLLIGAPLQGVNDDGALYYIRDIDKVSGIKLLSTASTRAAKWTGSTAEDFLTRSGDRNSAIRVMDVDGNGVTNDLIITCFMCNRGRLDNGVMYLIKDFNQMSGDLNLTTSQSICTATSCWSAAWATGGNGDMMGSLNGTFGAIQIVNMDGNATSNDLVVGSVFLDIGPTNSGGVFVVLDMNTRGGLQSLAASTNYNARVIGGTDSDFLTSIGYGGHSIQIINSDGNAYANDLLVAGSRVDAAHLNTGAVYLLKDIHFNNGETIDLNDAANFDARWAGAFFNDYLGDTNNSGPGIQVVNLDGNVAANDLVISAPNANINDLRDVGAVWVIKDINTVSGIKDLNSLTSNYSSRFWMNIGDEMVGYTNFGGPGVRIENLDGNAYANDLVIADANADYDSTDVGSVFIIRDVHLKSNGHDLNNESSYYRRYLGGSASGGLTSTLKSGSGMFITDTDNDVFPDAFFLAVQEDANGKSDAGAIYRIEDLVPFIEAGTSFSFVLMLPSSGCTADQGSTSGGDDCERAWVTGSSTATELEPEGQDAASNVPFFRYDNQSTTFSDFNIFLDLNASLPSTMVLKASNAGSGYQSSCNGNPSNNCVSITSDKKSVGTATYTAGSQDLNVYFWADYTAATTTTDRDVNSAPGFTVV